jgi:putative (di)nucleoside polyphosphate hydrolase
MPKYRKGVGIFLLNGENRLWVGKRIDMKSSYWQMPQGGIDGNETPKEAMQRELMEEVGIRKNYKIISETEYWLKYELPKELVGIVWNGKYVGQEQKWFACKFQGMDNEIKLDSHKAEFEDWKWINPTEALQTVVPFKKKLYKKLLDNFSEFYN